MKNKICFFAIISIFIALAVWIVISNNFSDHPSVNQKKDSPTVNIKISSKELLGSVKAWFYYLGFELDSILDDIVKSDYDMVVVEPVYTEKENQNYDIKSTITKIKNSSGKNLSNKLVLAYIDIGQAEDYRYYWHADWRIGKPDFIVGEDPDQWEGNFPVAFWKDEWQNIWFNKKDGQLKQLIEAGVDGVYLDWVEAYSDNNVKELAQKEGVDTVSKMTEFVGKIKRYGQEFNSNFLVIAQNAAELARYDNYVKNIDAISQEDIWFDGRADGHPEGDCPLPATDQEIDTDRYFASLSPECQKVYEEIPESTLHTSSQEIIDNLKIGQSKGLPIFTVDYAQKKENVQGAYEQSWSLGFIPFVSVKSLNKFIEPR